MSFPNASDQCSRAWRVERRTLKHPRTVRQGMSGFDVAALDG
jgi:hypothetical protein